MLISCSCPKCGSENTQRVSLAYQSGVSTSSSFSLGGFGGKGIRGLVGTIGASDSSSQLSDALAPPKRFSVLSASCWSLFWLLAGIFFISCASGPQDSGDPSTDQSTVRTFVVLTVISFIFLLVGIYKIYQGIKFNKRYAKLLNAWRRQYICMRCATRFDAG